MYPSRGTCSNQREYLADQNDIDELASEYNEVPTENIVLKHSGTRLNDPLNSRSGLAVDSILAIRLYIESFEYGAFS